MESKKSLSGRSILGLFAVTLLALLLICPQSAHAELNLKWTFTLSPPGGSGNYSGEQIVLDGLGGVVVRYSEFEEGIGTICHWITWINRAGQLVLNYRLPNDGVLVGAFPKVCYLIDVPDDNGASNLLVLYRNGQTALLPTEGSEQTFNYLGHVVSKPFSSTGFFSFEHVANEENPDLHSVLRVRKHTVF